MNAAEPLEPFAPWDDLEEGSITSLHDPAGPAVTVDRANVMVTDIKADVARSYQNDPPLQSDLLTRTLTELSAAASTQTGHLSVWAASLLDALWHRARSGVPYGEPQEPAWSLDPEPRHRNRRGQRSRVCDYCQKAGWCTESAGQWGCVGGCTDDRGRDD